jgi:plastocyanin
MKRLFLLTAITFLILSNAPTEKGRVYAEEKGKVEVHIPLGVTGFSPATQKVKAGATVTWINEDKRDHFLTAADPNRKEPARVAADLLIHQLLHQGDTFQMQFDKPGQYDFFCAIHMEMRGTLTVQP